MRWFANAGCVVGLGKIPYGGTEYLDGRGLVERVRMRRER